ncbi:MAG TPA: IS3 family transposase, partial [Clostridiales bacterium]|nr:IS3 family transposase [Clostridiales bacterium]
FIQLVKNSSLRQSMSRKGNCWDNAPQESFFGHMKDELAEKIPNWT